MTSLCRLNQCTLIAFSITIMLLSSSLYALDDPQNQESMGITTYQEIPLQYGAQITDLKTTKSNDLYEIVINTPTDAMQRWNISIFARSSALENWRLLRMLGGSLNSVPSSTTVVAVWDPYLELGSVGDYQFTVYCKGLLDIVMARRQDGRIALWSLLLTGVLTTTAYFIANESHSNYIAADNPVSVRAAREDFETKRTIFYSTCGLNLLPIGYYIYSRLKQSANTSSSERIRYSDDRGVN